MKATPLWLFTEYLTFAFLSLRKPCQKYKRHTQDSVPGKNGVPHQKSNIRPVINHIVKREKATCTDSLQFVTVSKAQVNPFLSYGN